jgi:hypothetical protein
LRADRSRLDNRNRPLIRLPALPLALRRRRRIGLDGRAAPARRLRCCRRVTSFPTSSRALGESAPPGTPRSAGAPFPPADLAEVARLDALRD